MRHELDLQNARNAVRAALKKGKRDTGILSRLRGHDSRILLLSHVVDAVSITGETYLGLQDVRVDRIIGTENRGREFSREFKPLRKWLEQRWMAVYDLLQRTEDEYRLFVAISRIEEPVPEFHPLPKEKGFYRFPYRELVHRIAAALKPQYGLAPYIHELTRQRGTSADQVRFYTRFSRRNLDQVLAGRIDGETLQVQVYGPDSRTRVRLEREDSDETCSHVSR
jgi:hypothetical protein